VNLTTNTENKSLPRNSLSTQQQQISLWCST